MMMVMVIIIKHNKEANKKPTQQHVLFKDGR